MKANEISLIDCVMARPGLNLRQLVQQCQLPQTTVHRTLANLCRAGLLLKQQDCYYLGPVLLRWINSSPLSQHERYAQLIRPHLAELARATGETVHLVQREGFTAFYIDKVEGSGPIALKSKVGNKLELYCTGAGRALLTLFRPDELREYWRSIERRAATPRTQTDARILEREIDHFREQGFAVEVEQDQLTIQCLGAALDLGRVQLAISITSTTLRQPKEFQQYAGLLKEISSRLNAELQVG